LAGARAAGWLFKKEPLIFQEKLIQINDNGFNFGAKARASTVGALLEEQCIVLSEHDELFPAPNTTLVPGMNIAIRRALPVTIQVDGEEIIHHTFKRTIEQALIEAGVTLSHLDKVKPTKLSGIEKDQEIVVTRIEIEQVTEEESIKFKTVEKEDSKLRWRKKKVKQAGVKGIKKVDYEITYKNGKQVSKEKLSSKTIEKPTDEIVAIGTKIDVGKTKVGVASWYAHTGTMACASRMFPRGTWLRVTSRENGKRVFVQVNDFGPMRGTGKMIDLDAVAFKKLAPLGKGVIEVKVEEILE